MIRSMTGYGRAQIVRGDHKFTVEIKSVNNRFFDANIRIPRQLGAYEAAVRGVLKEKIERGKVDVFIAYQDLSDKAVQVHYSPEAADQYVRVLRELASRYDLDARIPVTAIAGYPDVLVTQEEEAEHPELEDILLETVREALVPFTAAREREGSFLCADIEAKLTELEGHAAYIEERAPLLIAAYREKLTAKVADLIRDTAIEEGRILQEVTIYADRICVDEELVRLTSHIGAMRDELARPGSIGKKLDFLAQEMNRESNTILSKSDDLDVSAHAIELKTGVEKIREQVQNIE